MRKLIYYRYKPKVHYIEPHIKRLLTRFQVKYKPSRGLSKKIGYFIVSDMANGKQIHAQQLTYQNLHGQLLISSFYPELNKQPDSKFLSAALFYYTIAIFCKERGLKAGDTIILDAETREAADFYLKLTDFNFKIEHEIEQNIPIKGIIPSFDYIRFDEVH